MNPCPLLFAQVTKVFEFNQIALVKSPPAPINTMYFVGPNKDDAFFPYSSGPVHYLDRCYQDDDPIPVKLIHSLAKHLKIDRTQFWKDADAVIAEGDRVLAQVMILTKSKMGGSK